MNRFRTAFFAVLTFVFAASLAQADTYAIDPGHSSILFTVRHIIGKVAGHFDKFEGTFTYDEKNPKNWKTDAVIQAASINTGIEKRDAHLKSADFFDSEKYLTISFKSTGVSDLNGNKAKLSGDLTMHGVTKPVVLDLEILGVVKDPMGKGTRAGATATGHLNRNDFGVGPAAGKMASMVGDDIAITIEVEGTSK